MGVSSSGQAPFDMQRGESANALVTSQGIFETSTTQKHPLGTKREVGNRIFRYALASEALSKAKLSTQLGTILHEDTITVAHGIGTSRVSVTNDSNARVANYFTDGSLYVTEGTGAGDQYRIKGHGALAADAAVYSFDIFDGLQTAWSLSDTDVSLQVSPYVVQESNTDAIETPAGVQLVAVASGSYFWLQTYGPVAVLIDATGTFGNDIAERMGMISSNTAGAIKKIATIGNAVVGFTMGDGADYDDGKYGLFFLTLEH